MREPIAGIVAGAIAVTAGGGASIVVDRLFIDLEDAGRELERSWIAPLALPGAVPLAANRRRLPSAVTRSG